MDIRETLGQMVRGSVVNVLGKEVLFTCYGEFMIQPSPFEKPEFKTKSLKEVVEYFEGLSSPKALQVSWDDEQKALTKMVIPEAVTDEKVWEKRMAAPCVRPANIPDISLEDPPTQLYGRAQRNVKEALAYEIPTLSTLVEPCTPYGYINTDGLATMCKTIHRYNVNAGWWTDINTGEKLERNVPEMLMLIVSEVSEAMEGYRKDSMDDKLPHRKMIEVELADALIRICDTAEGLGLDLAGAVQEKVLFNVNRADHKIENRLKEGGKKF